jgi:adenylate kinase
VDEEEVVKRLLNRAREEGRIDDTEEVIRNRMNVYHSQTSPLIQYYQGQNKYLTVNGIGGIDVILSRICEILDEKL